MSLYYGGTRSNDLIRWGALGLNPSKVSSSQSLSPPLLETSKIEITYCHRRTVFDVSNEIVRPLGSHKKEWYSTDEGWLQSLGKIKFHSQLIIIQIPHLDFFVSIMYLLQNYEFKIDHPSYPINPSEWRFCLWGHFVPTRLVLCRLHLSSYFTDVTTLSIPLFEGIGPSSYWFNCGIRIIPQ